MTDATPAPTPDATDTPTERDLDVVVFGATGFTGRLVARYLAEHAPEGTRIALAGRSASRVRAVRDSLGGRASAWPVLSADAGDALALAAMVRRTRVVATTVGPYLKYGLPLVQACAAAGTHYVDLTGEVLFMRASIDTANAAAVASGARIVHACGFDSIPSDLGVHVLHRAAQQGGDGTLADVRYLFEAASGGFSGGTISSGLGQMEVAATDRKAARLLADPYGLSPDRDAEPDRADGAPRPVDIDPMVRHDDEAGRWMAPFVMSTINTRVVRRTNALAGYPYGRTFAYSEAVGPGGGLPGLLKAVVISGMTVGGFTALRLEPMRRLARRVLPKEGEGTGSPELGKGFFRVRLYGRTTDGRRLVATVSAPGDPGYAATSLMLGESALCLALDGDTLPPVAGVLTPATAMGDALVDRLRAAGMTLSVA